jgi:biotin transport system substrate-specific component
MKIILKGAIIGSLIFGAWSLLSWNGFKWYKLCIKQFENERFVSWVIRENATSGQAVYLSPYPFAKKKLESDIPFFYASIAPRGGVAVNFAKQGAFLGVMILVMGGITWMTTLVKPVEYWRRVAFITCIGTFADAVVRFPDMIWYGFSFPYTALSTLNAAIGFFLAALAIYILALFQTPRQAVMSTLTYLAAGTLGYPVFSGFQIKPLWFLGTDAGYIASFPLVTYIVAKCRHLSVGARVTIAAFTLKAIGMTYLSTFIGWKLAFIYGFALFIPSYIIKVMIAVAVARKFGVSANSTQNAHH